MEYLEKFKKDDSENEENEVDEEEMDRRLQVNERKKSVRYHQKVAHLLQDKPIDVSSIRKMKGPTLSVTCTALSEDDTTIYCGSKDASVFRFDVETGKKYRLRGGKKDSGDYLRDIVLSVAVSSDGTFLASAGVDRAISIWDTRSLTIVRRFQGHKGAISCLQFRQGSHDLYSGSFDRTVKLWNLDEMTFVDTLYGHQSEITSLDCLSRERAITGGADKTVRVWKIVEETQLLFKGNQRDSIDCVKLLNDDNWVSGSQDGTLALWNIRKKKHTVFVKDAALKFPSTSSFESKWPSSCTPWITSVGSCWQTDIVGMGSATGYLSFWEANYSKVDQSSLTAIQFVPLNGFINSINFSQKRQFVITGVGHEYKFGRWFRDSTAKNGVYLIPLPNLDEK
jgi:ribosomal RNA-processing protein 9